MTVAVSHSLTTVMTPLNTSAAHATQCHRPGWEQRHRILKLLRRLQAGEPRLGSGARTVRQPAVAKDILDLKVFQSNGFSPAQNRRLILAIITCFSTDGVYTCTGTTAAGHKQGNRIVLPGRPETRRSSTGPGSASLGHLKSPGQSNQACMDLDV